MNRNQPTCLIFILYVGIKGVDDFKIMTIIKINEITIKKKDENKSIK